MIYELSKFSESCNLHDKCIIDMQVAAFRKVPNTLKFLKLFSSVKRQKNAPQSGAFSFRPSHQVPLAVQPFGE
jgi:hypothetical protein